MIRYVSSKPCAFLPRKIQCFLTFQAIDNGAGANGGGLPVTWHALNPEFAILAATWDASDLGPEGIAVKQSNSTVFFRHETLLKLPKLRPLRALLLRFRFCLFFFSFFFFFFFSFLLFFFFFCLCGASAGLAETGNPRQYLLVIQIQSKKTLALHPNCVWVVSRPGCLGTAAGLPRSLTHSHGHIDAAYARC